MSNEDPNYFLSVDDETLDFLEKDSEKCLADINQAILRVKGSAFQILNILIIGIGSSFILLTQMKQMDYLAVGLLSFVILWTGNSIYLGLSCLSTSTRYLASTKPEYLYTDGYKDFNEETYLNLRKLGYCGEMDVLSVMRRFRLNTLSMTIDNSLSLNEKLAFRLNLSILITIISPLAAIIFAVTTFYYF